jgi:acetylornithine deacetylase/succinyl-diaminopimelate desuccinylase-like protein
VAALLRDLLRTTIKDGVFLMRRYPRLLLFLVLGALLALGILHLVRYLAWSRDAPALSRHSQRILKQAKLEYAAGREKYRDWLRDLVRYRTVSSESGNEAVFLACARQLQELVQRQIGCEVARVVERPGRRPAVLAQCTFGAESARLNIPSADRNQLVRSVLFYGHYDVQPAEAEKEGWTVTKDAFHPVETNDRIYARGVSDDKAGVAALLAAMTALRQRLDTVTTEEASRPMRPLVVKLLLEGEEEIGSPGFQDLIEQNEDLLFSAVCTAEPAPSCHHTSIDSIVSVDGGQIDDRTGALLLGMRGAAAFQVTVRGARHDVHSGQWGGAVPNPLQGLASLLAAFHYPGNGSVAIPGFYAGVRHQNSSNMPPVHASLLREAARALPSERTAAQHLGLRRLGGGEHTLFPDYLARIWFRPTLEIVGMGGGYIGEGLRGAIPAQAVAKVLMRLVPGQNATQIASAFCGTVQAYARQHLKSQGLSCSCHNLSFFAAPFESNLQNPLHSLLRATLLSAYGSRVIGVHSGASIPALSLLQVYANRRAHRDTQSAAAIPVGVLAFSLPSDQIHGPDEHFPWSRFDRAVHCYLDFLLRVREAPAATAPTSSVHSGVV